MTYGYTSIEDILLTILAILVILIFLGTIYSIFRSIFLFIFSNGETEKLKKVTDGIRYTVIGMIVTVLLLFLFPYVFSKIGTQSPQAYSAKAILDRAMDLGKKILRMGTGGPTGVTNPRTLDGGTSSPSYSETPL